jgi:tRNA threonylcarbamoyladenosine biosynthesis protein TsaB
MTILSIDTSTEVATISLDNEFNNIGEFTINNEKTHSEHLLSMIESMFNILKIEIENVDYIACSNGPGSFTGLRIGIATAKGLAHALNKKIISVPTLNALAYNVFSTSKIIVPIMNARRDNVYTSFYRWENDVPIAITEIMLENIDELISKIISLNESVIFCGDASVLFRNKILEAGLEIAPSNLILQKASSLGSLAFKLLKINGTVNYSDFMPFYLKATLAEREYEVKKQNA